MPVNILMPALSPTMEKGNLARWLKQEGDQVKAGDVIAEIETDKATMEYESIDDGVLAKIVVPEGSHDVPVNALIAILAQEGEDPKAAAAAKGLSSAKPAPAPPRPDTKGGDGGQTTVPKESVTPTAPAPPEKRKDEAAAARSSGEKRVFASPLARRLAKSAGMEISGISGSGPHGRIIARDISAATTGKGVGAPAAA